jgi:hypothetical protein
MHSTRNTNLTTAYLATTSALVHNGNDSGCCGARSDLCFTSIVHIVVNAELECLETVRVKHTSSIHAPLLYYYMKTTSNADSRGQYH